MDYLKVIAVLFLACFVPSCSENVKKHGYLPNEKDLSSLVIGKDDRKSVAAKIGLPITEGLEGSYYYVQSIFNAPGYKAAQLMNRTVVVVSFDEKNLLKNVETFAVQDEDIVRLDHRVTQTGLNNSSTLQQIFQSISGPSTSSLGL